VTASLLASHPAAVNTLGGVSDATRRPPALRPHGLRFAGRRLTDLKATAGPGVRPKLHSLLEGWGCEPPTHKEDPDEAPR
jgi:hypothetical protein